MKRRTFLALASAAAAQTFTAGNAAGQTPAVRFIAFGDAGTGDEQQAALARRMAVQHQAQAFDTAILLGDNIYPDGDLADVVAKFERPYAELLNRGVKFQAVLGNHDVRKGREAQLRYQHFNMGGHPYYTFTKEAAGVSLVDFFALDSTNYDTAQAQWLAGALSASRAPWKVAYFHHPIYSSGSAHGSDKALRAKLEPLLVKYAVTAVFSGHDHIYERIKPQQGVQYFVAGAGGKLRRGDLIEISPLTAAGNDEVSSFMLIEATPERFSFKAIDATGRVLDSGALAPRAVMRGTTAGK